MNPSFNYSGEQFYNIPILRIESLKSKIIKSVEENLVTFISSKTGSGKSTQVPKYLYEYLCNEKKKNIFSIICCEPRSIACESISKYIIKENKKIHKNINISIRVKEYLHQQGQNLFFLKESDLLFLLKEDPFIRNCDILIIDEVHERTMKLDLLLFYLKYFTLSRENIQRGFKLVFMSATFNTDDIHSYLSSIDNKNLTFGFIDQNGLEDNLREDNYDIYYSNTINTSLSYGNIRFNEYNMRKIFKEIVKIISYELYTNEFDVKTILVFLPDYKSIYSLSNLLNKEFRGYINIYQFCSALSITEQTYVINELYQFTENNRNYYPRKICNVVIATTLAETCLTFPNCQVVIDCGLRKNCRYNYDSNLYEEIIEYISQDSCIQRSGRCGRGEDRGTCYRLFSEESFNLMDKFRKPDIETGNIDLIILKLFENINISKFVKEDIEKKGYLDFLSKIEKDKFYKILKKLYKYDAIKKIENSDYERVTYFGTWAMKANIDVEIGYYFDKFKDKYPEDIKKEYVFQMLNVISTTDNYNCELFYTDIDPEWFKLNLLDYNKNTKDTKTLIDLSKKISKNIIRNGLVKFQIEESNEEEINKINEEKKRMEKTNNSFLLNVNHISPYYYLFSKLDEIYSGKNFYSKNKIFQLGDWTISLFFINQYKLIKCLIHYYQDNNHHYQDNNHYYNQDNNKQQCKKCKIEKYYYCAVYSLNEKYFTKQKNRNDHIKSVLKYDFINEYDFTICKREESLIAKWNIIYLNLISKKPDKYINENQIIKYINEFKLLNFDEIMNTLYEEYKKLYIDIATKYLGITKNDDEMLIQRSIFQNEEENRINIENKNDEKKIENNGNKIILYFNNIDKVNLMRSYFFEFIPKNVDKYFCLTKFRKILGTDKKDEKKIKLSKLFYKVINPIFDEMISKSYKLKEHFELLNKKIDQKAIRIYNNVGKYFYNHFISPKIPDKNIEIYQNSVVYIYSRINRDLNKEQKIEDLIKNEKENYCNKLDFIQCLKGGCITIQITQGLLVKNIFDTYQNRSINKNKLLYIIKFNNDDNDETKDNNYYFNKITENKNLKYEKLIILDEKLIIVFSDSLQFTLFTQKQNLNLTLIPYKENISSLNEDNNEKNFSNMKIYIVRFDPSFSTKDIHKKMKIYMRKINNKYNCKLNYYIDEVNNSNSKTVYYYINSENPIKIAEKEIFGQECKEGFNKKNFSIDRLSFTSDYEYILKFMDFCRTNNLNIIRKKQKINNANEFQNYYFIKEYELINYSEENMKLIQNYIGFTSITLNSFALYELRSKSRDTFLQYNQNIYQYARQMYCNVYIIYYENKIKIYGEPKHRKKLYEIISKYFSDLQNEKIIFSLKGKEDNLLLKTISKKVNQNQIVMLISKNDQGGIQLEFRKKYFDFITELLHYKKKRKIINQIKSTRCEICLEKFDNQNNNNYFKLTICGHKFCVECLKMQISNSLQLTSGNSIPIRCVKCNTIITNNDIFEIFIPNTPEYEFIMNKLITIFMLKNSAELNFNSHKKYYWCPNKKENCNYVYSSLMKESGETILTCPNCSCKICLLCNDILDPSIPHNPDCQSKLYSRLSDENRKWMLKNSKDCPMCHTVYEKNQGCNHMTCTICHPPTHFCYICGNILNNDNPLQHFSDTGSKCYNKLWDDEAKNENIIDNNDDNHDNEDNDKNDDNDDNSENDDNDDQNIINDNNNQEDDKMFDNNSRSNRANNNSGSSYNFNSRFQNRRTNDNFNNNNLNQIMFERVNYNDSNINYYNSIYNSSFNHINNHSKPSNNNIRNKRNNQNNHYNNYEDDE